MCDIAQAKDIFQQAYKANERILGEIKEAYLYDFMFQLTKKEVGIVKSQIVTSPDYNFYSGQEGGRRK